MVQTYLCVEDYYAHVIDGELRLRGEKSFLQGSKEPVVEQGTENRLPNPNILWQTRLQNGEWIPLQKEFSTSTLGSKCGEREKETSGESQKN